MPVPVKRIHQGPAAYTLLFICKQQLFTVLYQLRHTLFSLHRPLLLLRAVLHGSYQRRDIFCHGIAKHYIYEVKRL